jgi:hypothetical protein
MIRMQLSGFDAMVRVLKETPEAFLPQLVTVSTKIAVDAKEKSRQKAPYISGALRRSIDYRITEVDAKNLKVTFVVGSDLPYARIKELGGIIPSHTIVPKSRKSLAWKDPSSPYAGKGGWVFARSVVIPERYVPATPYLFPTLVENVQRWLDQYKGTFDQAVIDAGGKQ